MKRHLEFERFLKGFVEQFKEGARLGGKFRLKKKPQLLIICGMGGSALPGLIVKAMSLHKIWRVPVLSWRNYGLPPIVPPQSQIICISYSGNTEETVSSFSEAKRARHPLLVITSGGKLRELAKKYRVPLVKIPSGLLPRLALGYMAGAIISVSGSEAMLGRARPRIDLALAKRIAKNLRGKIPLIYAPTEWETVAHIWKLAFNENSQIPAFTYTFPEMNHNEMMGLAGKPSPVNKNFVAILLRDRWSHPRIQKRMRLTAPVLKRAGIKTITVDIKGRSFFEKLFSGILLGYWTSYWAAMGRGANPLEERLIEEFKYLMKKGR